MIATVTKYIALVLCGFYVYIKLLYIKPHKKTILFGVLFSIATAIGTYFLRFYAAPLSILVMVGLFILFATKVFSTPINTCITTSVLSFAFSYAAIVLAAAVMLPWAYFVLSFLAYSDILDIVSQALVGFTQFAVIKILFKSKRLRKGMPFLLEYGSADTGVFISVSLLLAASFFGARDWEGQDLVIPTVFIAVCGITLLFWWRNQLTKTYLKKIREQEANRLQELLETQAVEMEQLKQYNDELSKVIHKDNKLIPAMELAVREYLSVGEDGASTPKADTLLLQLAALAQDRKGILKDVESANHTIPLTEVPLVDTMLAYFSCKAQTLDIAFDVSISGSIRHMVKYTVSEPDLRTLLSDMIENAMIACRAAEKKRVHVHIGISRRCYTIDVFDSGEPFAAEAVKNLGVHCFTSHADTGGSGIGMVTVFEIMRNYEASFLIESYSADTLFTKRVSIRWDQQAQRQIINSAHRDACATGWVETHRSLQMQKPS